MTEDKTYEILHKPFDPDTHNKYFICYCETVILRDGTVEYAVPSHEQKLVEIYARNHRMTNAEVIANFYMDIDAIEKMMKDTGVVFVWYDFISHETELTYPQKEALDMLNNKKCINLNKKYNYIKGV